MAISTQSSSTHVEERDQERIPKPVSTGVENATHGRSTPYLSSLLLRRFVFRMVKVSVKSE